jgi:hypothetical protein
MSAFERLADLLIGDEAVSRPDAGNVRSLCTATFKLLMRNAKAPHWPVPYRGLLRWFPRQPISFAL